MGMNFGYKASAEQFGPSELLRYSIHAEEAGLDTIAVSDHFQPWRHNGGHAPNALVWLGALRRLDEERHAGDERADPDAALRAGDRRPGLRNPGKPVPGPGDPGRRNR